MTDASSSTPNALILTPAQAVSSEPPDKTPLCGICRRQFSRYTCPRCNLLYCSLQCFRANAHSQCSEPFYRTQLESDIRAEPSKSAAERAQMMSLLKRFEEDNLDDPFDGEDDADDETDLERRLAGLNLDNATYDDLWAALTPAERAAFTKAVQDPSSALAQQLLTSPELADETVAPWWEEPSDAAPRSTSPPKKYGHPPEIIAIPPALLAPPLPDPPSFPLAYNLVATILAYAYATRRFAVSPLARCEAEADVRAAIVRVVPFLADKRSTVRFSTLEAVVTDIYSRFEEASLFPLPCRPNADRRTRAR
ncbi:hypothetical protein BV25DRAFT_1827494 [Artomyces pyxidatus]|uniref:Uncharacterized protein n=1 Tax=Artomyces pyxidatus TaxID=48021 RepID=A0ACB8SY63_9AGAM|nr:hypothetical protein BV25DRAFT_1827494 [Artomyces pyxidatus]